MHASLRISKLCVDERPAHRNSDNDWQSNVANGVEVTMSPSVFFNFLFIMVVLKIERDRDNT